MKKDLLILLFISVFGFGYAQTALPYHTGFDNVAEKAGWQEFRKGYLGTYKWGFQVFNAYTPPNSLYHDYPVGSAGTDTTIDWYVSPGFDFSSGGKIDSIRIKVYSITGSLTPADHIGLYLLSGSNDPAAASVTLLADLTSQVSSSATWNDAGNHVIPPAIGNSYIGIKYRATNNWFTVNIDHIYISSNPSGIGSANAIQNELILYPNPATNKVELIIPQDIHEPEIQVVNVAGQVVMSQKTGNQLSITLLDISTLEPGTYFIHILENGEALSIRKLVVAR
jgi:hypothetical protein